MADNQYRKYLDEQEQANRTRNWEDIGVIGAGVGLGVGMAVSPRLRGGVINSAKQVGGHIGGAVFAGASYLNRASRLPERAGTAMAYLRSMDHALDMRSPLSHFTNPARYEERLEEQLRREFQTLSRRGQSVFKGKPTDIERDLSHLQNALRHNTQMYIKATQRSLAMNDMQHRLGADFTDDMQAIIRSRGDEFFGQPSKNAIRDLLDRYSAPVGTNNQAYSINVAGREDHFVNQIFESLRTFSDARNIDRKKLISRGGEIDGVKIQGSKALKEKEWEAFKDRNAAREDFMDKIMSGIGNRRLLVRDALEYDDVKKKWVNKLFDNDSIRKHHGDGKAFGRGAKQRSAFDANLGNKLAALANKDASILDLAVDSKMYINDAGEVVDFRGVAEGLNKGLNYFADNFQIPWLRFNPLDLIHWSTIQGVKESPLTYFFRKGTIQPALQGAVKTMRHPHQHNQDAAVGPLADEYMLIGDKVSHVVSGEVVKEGVYLASARFGMIPRAMSSMANLHRRDLRDRGMMGKLFDMGGQESEHLWSRMGSMFTKFDDPNWAPNRFRAIFSANAATPDGMKALEASYKDLYNELHTRARPLSDDTVNYLNQYVSQAYGPRVNVDLHNMRSDEEIMSTLGRIRNSFGPKNQQIFDDHLGRVIGQEWSQYRANPIEFFKNKRIVTDNHPVMIGPVQSVDTHETTLVNKIEDIKRLIHQHALQQIDFQKKYTVGDLINQGVASGQLSRSAIDEVKDLNLLSTMNQYWDDVYKHPQDKGTALTQFQESIVGSGQGTDLANNFNDFIERTNQWYHAGPGDKPPQYFGLIGSMAVNKARGYQWAQQRSNELMQQGLSPLHAGVKSALGVISQPFSGRRNLGDVTTATLPFYYYAERLDNALAKVGFGLSQPNRGSMQSILGNQFLRRIVMPYAALQQLQYFDGLTGDFASDNLADGYASMHQDTAFLKDITGVNRIFRELGQLTPGFDQFWKNPIGGALKYGTFGFFGDSRSAEEVQQYYESGEDPIRKGRWWSIGSMTPYEGGAISYYAPNWYRRAKSDYKFTDTMYGSETEYWRNHWMPTLTNPLAPLRHFLIDPDHYANKHAEDRPYPIKGGIAELDMVPLVGPLLNRTVGGVLNPYVKHRDLEKSHRQYMEDMNNYIAGQYESALGGGTLQLMPAGGWQLMSEGEFGGGFGEGLASFNAPATGGAYGGGGDQATGGPVTTIGGASRGQLAAINAGIGSVTAPARPITSLESLRDPDFVADLADVKNPYGIGNLAGDSWYTLTEMAGIYGFSANMLAGVDTNIRTMALDRSSRMNSYSRAWWDMEMGGLGGEMSEIFRRYVPRDPRKQYYNPIRNTMPEWMPGINYYIDFQHGDPFTKIARGEMRLPGAAYESLNQLHPDQFGEYGAFDRFKILADVAPYSDEYKFWRRTVSQMNQQGMLSEDEVSEYAEIRDQVSNRKDKYHLYPYRFKNADINKEKVTVTKVLDANTFLTAEHPNNPIRLAGVRIPSDATEVQEWLQQFIHEGAKLTIGVDADPLFRIRDDTMNTMHAVVYSPGEGMLPWYDSKGQSLNAMLANRSFGGFLGIGGENPVKVTSDTSAVATAALFDEAQVTVGSMWETMVHSVLPSVPILGTVMDKFMQVRSPLEMYKRNELYGKAWRPWYDPWGGWIEPMLENAASHNPAVAAVQGYGTGWLFGRTGLGRYHGKWVGAAVFGGLAALRAFDEAVGSTMDDDYAWIPERRQREREINQYFDMLKYMKYRGLYNRAREEAEQYEGIDLDQILDESGERGEGNKRARRYLETTKKWLSISKKLGYVDDDIIEEQLDKVRGELKGIDANRPAFQLGPRAMQALQYRLQYESTLYGADPNGDMQKIFRALPDKDREFFQHFMTASPSEREEILRLVPEDQKRFYQAKWGMDVDEKPSLSAYFATHNLPGANWEGWRPDVNLDDIKFKVVRNEALEATDFGMWQDDAKRAEQSGVDTINPFRPSMLLDVARIEKILQGAGLKDIYVTMDVVPNKDGNKIELAMDIMQDRVEDLKRELSDRIGSLL